MTNTSDSDHIGRIGEDFFNSLANKARLLVGQVIPDRIGRDRMLEFELAPKGTLPYDKRPAPVGCSVQIKTIFDSNERATLSLSVAERLAKDSRPTFVCIIRVDEEDEVTDMHLVHLLDENLATILRRLREEYSKNNEKLHKTTTSFTISDGVRVDLKPKAFKEAFQNIVHLNMEEYSKKKLQQLETLGFKRDGILTSNMSFDINTIDDFVEGMLGLRKLKVTDLEMFEERFGIKLPFEGLPFTSSQPVSLEVTPATSHKGYLLLEKPDGSEKAELECELIFPGIPDLQHEHLKFIARTSICDVIIGSGSFKINQTKVIDDDTKLSLLEWDNILKSWEISSSEEFSVSILSEERKRFFKGSCNHKSTAKKRYFGRERHILKQFHDLRVEAKGGAASVSLEEILENHNEIDFAYACIFESDRFDKGWKFAISGEVPLEEGFAEILLIYPLTVGDEEYAIGLKLEATIKSTEEDLKITVENFTPLQIAKIGGHFEKQKDFEVALRKISGIQLSLISSGIDNGAEDEALLS